MKITESTKIPRFECSCCGYSPDMTWGLSDERIPMMGDLSLCMKCGHVVMFTAGLGVREIEDWEWKQIRKGDAWIKIQKARSLIIRIPKEAWKNLNNG